LVNRYANGIHVFDEASDILKFAFLGGVVSPVVSATTGVGSLALFGYAAWSDYATIWLTWWLGDMGGALIITPLLLLWRTPRVQWSNARAIEALVLLCSLLVIGQLIFGSFLPITAMRYPIQF